MRESYKFNAGLGSLALQVPVATAVEEAVQVTKEIVAHAESSVYDSSGWGLFWKQYNPMFLMMLCDS